MRRIKILFCVILMSHIAYSQVPNTWTAKSNFGGTARYGAGSFSIGNKGYFVAGVDGAGYQPDVWQYDPTNDTWSQKADFGGGQRRYLACFSIGNKGYAGTGYDGSTNNNDFYEYNPTLNIWIQKAFFPGVARSASTAFSIGNKGYLGLGTAGASVYQDFYEYDPLTDSWTAKTNFPGAAREQATGLGLDGKGYIGLGKAATMTFYNDFWQYDPISNTWLQKANFGGLARCGAVGFAIGQRAYIGTGSPDGAVTNYKDFWEYNPATDIWLQKANVGSTGRDAAAGFAIGNKGYIGSGLISSSTSSQTFLEYNPSLITYISAHTDVSCIGGSNGTASSISYGGTPPYIYSWAPGGGISANATGLVPGIYTITVTDASFTTATATVNIAAAGGPNSWVQKANFGGNKRYRGVAFSIGSKAYVGTGYDALDVKKQDFWEYDPTTNVWTQKADYGGGPRVGATGFSINNKGYVGTGVNNSSNYTNDLWEYNPTTNLWGQKAFMPTSGRASAVGFAIGSKGYIGTGNDNIPNYLQDFWEYNPANDTWVQKANYGGGGVTNSIGFSIGEKGYIGTGSDNSTNHQDFWEYDPATNLWLQKANVGGGLRTGGSGFSIGTKGYIGIGYNGGGDKQDFWEYNTEVNQWTQKADFGGLIRFNAVAFSVGGKAYIGTGTKNTGSGADSFDDLWEYTSSLSVTLSAQTNVSCNGGSTGSATASPSGGNAPYSFSWNTTPVQTSATATNIVAGNYTCTVTDCDGSIATCTVAISQSGAPDSWTQKASFPAVNRGSGVAFSIGSKGYFGTGENTNGVTEYNDFWEYDPITNVWTQKANFGGVARKGATGFSIGSKGYLGIGHDNISGFKNDFWEYNPTTNTWLQKANFPPVKRYAAVGFSIGNKGYMGTGYENQSTGSFIWYNDFWEFDPATNTWLQRASVPGNVRANAIGFSIDSKGYVGTGAKANTPADLLSDFYEFDPITNTWTQKANYGGGVIQYAAAFSINSRGYVGTGSDAVVFKQDFWEYNPTTDTWVQKANFGGSARYGAKSFAIGTKGYIVKGYDGAHQQDLWEYNPSAPIVTASFTSINTGQTVSFTNTTTNGTTYLWNFGDGTTSTSINPTHTYANGGTYNVCLTATNECVSNQTCSSITFGCSNPIAVFTSNVSGLTANFTNTSANATSYNWNFGDATSSTQQTPSHVYNASGTYTVSLTTTNGCGTATVTHTVTVTCVAPTASYVFTVSGITATFTNTSPNAANVSWSFSDPASGTNNIASTANPSHVFSAPGLYNVTLYVNNACGTDSITQAVLVNCALPVSNFVSNPNGLSVQLNGLASTNAFTYSWSFGDATAISIFPFDTHTYLNTGTYNVCLTTSNSCGSDTRCDSITVCAAPVASFSSAAIATNASFTNTSTQATNWFWTFGDGIASSMQNPTHQFASSGTKTICLMASNTCGSDTICNNMFLFCSSGLTPSICMVSVDTLSSHNEIFWDKTGYATSDTFLVYRDTANYNYALIGKVPFDSLSMFNDTIRSLYNANGDPNVSSWRYKIAVQDSCGNISAMSPYHQTMFIQNNSGNFSWNHYQIEGQTTPVPVLNSYEITRDDLSTGAVNVIQSLSASSTAFTDVNYATYQATADWRVFTNWAISCDPTLRLTNGSHDVQTIVVKSKSNIKNNRTIGIKDSKNQKTRLKVYPNPAKDILNIEVSLSKETQATITLENMLGQVVYIKQASQQLNQLNISTFVSGVYFVKVNTGKGIVVEKIIIE